MSKPATPSIWKCGGICLCIGSEISDKLWGYILTLRNGVFGFLHTRRWANLRQTGSKHRLLFVCVFPFGNVRVIPFPEWVKRTPSQGTKLHFVAAPTATVQAFQPYAPPGGGQ